MQPLALLLFDHLGDAQRILVNPGRDGVRDNAPQDLSWDGVDLYRVSAERLGPTISGFRRPGWQTVFNDLRLGDC